MECAEHGAEEVEFVAVHVHVEPGVEATAAVHNVPAEFSASPSAAPVIEVMVPAPVAEHIAPLVPENEAAVGEAAVRSIHQRNNVGNDLHQERPCPSRWHRWQPGRASMEACHSSSDEELSEWVTIEAWSDEEKEKGKEEKKECPKEVVWKVVDWKRKRSGKVIFGRWDLEKREDKVLEKVDEEKAPRLEGGSEKEVEQTLEAKGELRTIRMVGQQWTIARCR